MCGFNGNSKMEIYSHFLLAHPDYPTANLEFQNPPSTRPVKPAGCPHTPRNHLNVRSKNTLRNTANPGVPSIYRRSHNRPLLASGKPGMRHYQADNMLNYQEAGNFSDEVIVNCQP
jgi:hypothetical protein